MSNTTTTTQMGLIVPTVSVDPGPDYAVNINTDLGIIDVHNHTPGKGVPVPSSGLNINSDLTFQNNNLTLARSTRFQAQVIPISAASDVGAVYVAGADLYYNDTAGNQIRLTQGGAISGTAGSISGLTAPATASYSAVSKTFVWQSDVSTPANLDAASVILRNLSASSNGLTLSAPAALASNFTITLPTIPAATSFLGIDGSGNVISVGSVSQGITKSNLAPLGQSTSNTVNWTGTSSNIATICSVSITTIGRPIMLMLQSAGGATASYLSVFNTGSQTGGIIRIAIGSTSIVQQDLHASNYGGTFTQLIVPASMQHMDNQSAGTYVYLLQGYVANVFEGANQQFTMNNCKLIAYEM